jgi:soluble lytic murein transglycosylase-like protein
VAVEIVALGVALVVALIAVLGRLAAALGGGGTWWQLLPFVAGVLGVGVVAAVALRGWWTLHRRLARDAPASPAIAASVLAVLALILATRPAFQDDVASLRTLLGGRAEMARLALEHQVYAAYRRADSGEMLRVLERARVYEPTVQEAGAAFNVDAEVLMGVAAAESAFYPRDSPDGGRGLFQITSPPAGAVDEVNRRLGTSRLDPLNQRHNAFVAAATLHRYLDEMHGDLFLGLLAYNIGPRNGGLRSIMEQYGARDFVTIQPYLHTLPRDYPVRVLAAALAYRLWRREGQLLRYEEGDNARRIQRVGIPGLTPGTGVSNPPGTT